MEGGLKELAGYRLERAEEQLKNAKCFVQNIEAYVSSISEAI